LEDSIEESISIAREFF